MIRLPRRTTWATALVILSTAACNGTSAESASGPEVQALRNRVADVMQRPEKQAERVEVAHILISFEGTGTDATRSRAEAEQLAAELLQQVQQPDADFGDLMKRYSDDTGPGIYGMFADMGARQQNDYARQQMAPAFGDVSWRLDVGEIGVAPFHPQASRFGWHIIQRRQ